MWNSKFCNFLTSRKLIKMSKSFGLDSFSIKLLKICNKNRIEVLTSGFFTFEIRSGTRSGFFTFEFGNICDNIQKMFTQMSSTLYCVSKLK